jgi:hypothetical protein
MMELFLSFELGLSEWGIVLAKRVPQRSMGLPYSILLAKNSATNFRAFFKVRPE